MKEGWTRAYLSIGSNRGDTAANLDRAVAALKALPDVRVTSESARYKTAPQNFQDQDWFLNAALEIETRLAPESLLEMLKHLERELDKEGKAFRFGPRDIDLDIVLYGDLIFRTPKLEIPHPRMHERCFVLRPLCDIDREIVHPGLGKSVQELLKEINTKENQAVIPLEQEV